jgi:hypothetical protein
MANRSRRARSSWEGARCPLCATTLSSWIESVTELANGARLRILLLACERDHCWQENVDLSTGHSALHVERRRELEGELRRLRGAAAVKQALADRAAGSSPGARRRRGRGRN